MNSQSDSCAKTGDDLSEVSNSRIPMIENTSERPPFVDPDAEYVTCHICGQTWDPTAVDGLDLSTEDEYYPTMVPVCPEHMGGCR